MLRHIISSVQERDVIMKQKNLNHKTQIGIIIAEKGKLGRLLIDIDNSSLVQIYNEIRKIQSEYKLGNCAVVKSSQNHYHACFFWNFLEWVKITKIIEDFPIADKEFIKFKKKCGFLRIRLTDMPKQRPIMVKSEYQRKDQLGDFLYNHHLSWLGVRNA